MKVRTGRKVGRTLYLQVGEQSSDDDLLIGVMDTRKLGRLVAAAMNAYMRPEDWKDLAADLNQNRSL